MITQFLTVIGCNNRSRSAILRNMNPPAANGQRSIIIIQTSIVQAFEFLDNIRRMLEYWTGHEVPEALSLFRNAFFAKAESE